MSETGVVFPEGSTPGFLADLSAHARAQAGTGDASRVGDAEGGDALTNDARYAAGAR